jgi:hydroxymethylglutaryl-CoA lyase
MEMVETVKIREVGPRDGFQNEPETIPTAQKVELIDALARTSVKRLEVTSFVRPDVIPQLADAAEVLKRIDVPEEVACQRSRAERARAWRTRLRCWKRRARVGTGRRLTRSTCSCPHRRRTTSKNVNRSIEESLAGLETCWVARERQGCAARA